MSYYGYENWETWNTVNWFTNSRGGYEIIQNIIEELKNKELSEDDFKTALRDSLIDRMQDTADIVRNLFNDTENPEKQIIIELINGGIERINWYEVIQSVIEE